MEAVAEIIPFAVRDEDFCNVVAGKKGLGKLNARCSNYWRHEWLDLTLISLMKYLALKSNGNHSTFWEFESL